MVRGLNPRAVLVGVTLCWAALAQAAYSPDHSYLQQLERKLSALERKLHSGLSRLGDVEEVLTGE